MVSFDWCRLVNGIPMNYDLGLRVQALESLIRSGSNVESEAASSAAMETILQARRAAKTGSKGADNAFVQSTDNGIGTLGHDAQGSILMDVLQQVSLSK